MIKFSKAKFERNEQFTKLSDCWVVTDSDGQFEVFDNEAMALYVVREANKEGLEYEIDYAEFNTLEEE